MHAPHAPAARDARRAGITVLLALLSMNGPFSTDAYLPAFHEIGASLHATPAQVQQTLSAFMVAYAAMNLWHGAVSDALGRSRVIVGSLAIYVVASVGCAFAGSIEALIAWRIVQGLSGGAGQVVGRAVIRDLYQGADAQRQMARVSMLFVAAPVMAPFFGGLLSSRFGWASVFVAIAAMAALLAIACAAMLPETLPPARRVPFRAGVLVRGYAQVFRNARFRRLAGALTCGQSAMFISIAGAPAIILDHYGLGQTDFVLQFGPMVVGLFLGSVVSGRMAGRVHRDRQTRLGFAWMAASVAAELALAIGHVRVLPWNFAPILFFAFGLMLLMPAFTVRLLDEMPSIAGTVSSCQSFAQGVGMAIAAGVLVPLVQFSLVAIAAAKLVLLVAGYLLWRGDQRPEAKGPGARGSGAKGPAT
jgi:DHA1 family bicyclomycin/chloramphenicol resistance-like MFS transporter